MDWLRELTRRLKMLTLRRQFDADLEEEMRLHLELRQEEQLRSGMTANEARAAARRRFGNATYLKEESHMAWGWEWFENAEQDVRYGLRVLRKSPGFSAVAILTIALGIGATTAIFTVVDATLLHPLPYPQPEQLVSIEYDFTGVGARDVGMSEPEWHVRILIVAPNYFALLGVKPLIALVSGGKGNSQPPNCDVLHDLPRVWRSPGSCKLLKNSTAQRSHGRGRRLLLNRS